MTEPLTAPPADTREIEPEAPQYNARIVRREDLHESLIYVWVNFDAEPTPFLPGQYMTIGVFADGKLVQRPYSVASTRSWPATRATSSTSASSRAARSPRSCGGCRSATACG